MKWISIRVMLFAIGTAMANHVDGVPRPAACVGIADLDQIVNFVATRDGQGGDGTPTTAIIGTKERDFARSRLHLDDARQLNDCG